MKGSCQANYPSSLAPGDVLIDRAGNEMIVVEVVSKFTGECYALHNGNIKLINAYRASVMSERDKKASAINDKRC